MSAPGKPGPAPPRGPYPMFPDWYPAADEYGRVYWYNALTNETSWENPAVLAARTPKSPPGSGAGSSLGDVSGSFASARAGESAVFSSISAMSVAGSGYYYSGEASGETASLGSTSGLDSFSRDGSGYVPVAASASAPVASSGVYSVAGSAVYRPSPSSPKDVYYPGGYGLEEKSLSPTPRKTVKPFTPTTTPIDTSVDPVKELINIAKLPWNFANDHVHTYRVQASKIDHRSCFPSPIYMTFPRYFSTAPIPETKTVTCRVTLPVGANKSLAFTKIVVSPTESASYAISLALKKCVDKVFPPEQCLFKVVGKADYIYGEENLFNFDYIRYQIRHGLEVLLSLHFVPDMAERIEATRLQLEMDLAKLPYPKEVVEKRIPSLEQSEDKGEVKESWDQWLYIPIQRLDLPLRVQIIGVDNLDFFPRYDSSSISNVFVKFELYHGTRPIRNTMFTTSKVSTGTSDPRFYQYFSLTSPSLCKLPWATRVSFLIYGTKDDSNILLGFVTLQLFDHQNTLLAGKKNFRLWTVPAVKESVYDDLNFICRGTTRENLSTEKVPILNVKFDDFALPVVNKPILEAKRDTAPDRSSATLTLDPKTRQSLNEIICKDILTQLKDDEKSLLWSARRLFLDNPLVLPKVLQCVDWTDPAMASAARSLLFEWAPFENPLDALQLLDAQYADPMVRQFAVNALNALSDFELKEYLLQLVQVLKYESHHFSVLSQFLISRAIQSPYDVGHNLFWHLKSELHNPDFCERFAVILEEYLVKCRRHAYELWTQEKVVLKLLDIAEGIFKAKSIDKKDSSFCKDQLRTELAELNKSFPSNYQIPLNPRWQAKSIVVEECKYMSSKKVPLWLSFENTDPEGDKMLVIFKAGDDLRQDQLTLQMIRVMDRLWLGTGTSLDMRMKPYTCVSTGVNKDGEGVGMLEIVTKSSTISRIQIEEGGGAFGALRLNPLDDYIKKYNTGVLYDIAVQNFVRSCAGYCVATFVMGIGDRHNDNIMLTQSGHLFHIDFGHFLGNFKKKMGFRRERSPFVFTPEMAFVMGGLSSDTYKEFEDICCNSFNVLRRKSSFLMCLFQLMQSAGMPELSCQDDITYLRDQLSLDKTDEESSASFRKEITGSHSDFYRRLDNTIHNFKHS